MHKNNFDLLRLSLALTVVFGHARLIGETFKLPFTGVVFDGFIAVQCFFVISGYLIFQSWENVHSLREYVSKRVRRIYPAYLAVVVSSAFLGSFVSSLPLTEYFMSASWFKYLAANLVFLNFLQPSLPGVFLAGDDSLVNGPLWTIKIEVMFYSIVPVIAWLAAGKRKLIVFSAIYILSVIWVEYFTYLFVETGEITYHELTRQLPGQMTFFIAGGMLYYYFDFFKNHAFIISSVSVFLFATHFYYPLPWIFPMALGIIVIYVARMAPYLGNFGRFGDFSYGIYIVHYPILQTVRALNIFESEPILAFATGAFISALLAILSSHLVERPWLLSSSHYRQVAERRVSVMSMLRSSSQER
jgi:peptidoglycan/LPS O-acetylase OafA/YrhL